MRGAAWITIGVLALGGVAPGARAAEPGGGAPPPVLLDPAGARDWAARSGMDPGLRAAELLLLAGDAGAALARAEGVGEDAAAGSAEQRARRLRILLDASVVLERDRQAEGYALALAQAPGWAKHATRQLQRLQARSFYRALGDAGAMTFAMAFGFLVLGGGRELLRAGRELLVAGAGLAGVVGLVSGSTHVLGTALVLCSAAVVTLIHAASAALRRLAPGTRGRFFLFALVALGGLGAFAAVLARLDPVLLGRGLAL